MNRIIAACLLLAQIFIGGTAAAASTPTPGQSKETAAAATAQGKAPEPLTKPSPPCQTRYQLQLATPPPTRVRLSLDTDQGGHTEQEWDPAQPQRLVRFVSLPVCDNVKLYVSAWAEPFPLLGASGQSSYVYITFPNNGLPFTNGPTKLEGTPQLVSIQADNKVASSTTGEIQPKVTLTVQKSEERSWPTVEQAKRTLSTGAQDGGAGRSLSAVVPAGVTEVFQILAEIAFERAKTKGLHQLRERISSIVCETLKWPDNLWQGNDRSQTGLVLPETCQATRSLRIEDLAASGSAIYLALMRDLTTAGFQVAMHQLKQVLEQPAQVEGASANPNQKMFRSALAQLPYLVGQITRSGGAIAAKDAQLLLLSLAQVQWRTFSTKEDKTDILPAIDLGFAILATCIEKGGCNAAEIAELACSAKSQFSDGNEFLKETCISTQWPQVRQFVARGLDILSPPKGSTPRLVAESSIDLVMDLLELLAQHRVQMNGSQKSAHDKVLPVLQGLRAMIHGILHQDAQQVIAAVPALLANTLDNDQYKRIERPLTRATALLGGLVSYATTYSMDGKSDVLAKAQHEARKKAIESLLNSATDRSNRDGEWVLSVGANVGFLAVGAEGRRSASIERPDISYMQLGLPMGIAAQWLPSVERPSCKGKFAGLHLQLSLVDLAQFLAFDNAGQLSNIHWANFVQVGTQIGAILGKPNANVIVGVEARWTPTLFGTVSADGGAAMTGEVAGTDGITRGVWRAGVFFSYYVPFFDFN